VERAAKPIALQPREFRLLEHLVRHQGQVVTRTMLFEAVWDYSFDPQTNVIDVQISRRRRKIDRDFTPQLLHTVRGIGVYNIHRMTRFWGNVAFWLALGYGLLAVGSMSVISAVFFFGTVGVLARSTDAKLQLISERLAEHFETRGGEGLRQEVQQLLADGIDRDTEVYLLIAPDGRKIIEISLAGPISRHRLAA
jgi:Transcriptional regulatory protein, C terminal